MFRKHKLRVIAMVTAAKIMSDDHHGTDCDNDVQGNYGYNGEDNFDYYKYYIYILILLLLLLQSCLKLLWS
jgi:hypothetical protein